MRRSSHPRLPLKIDRRSPCFNGIPPNDFSTRNTSRSFRKTTSTRPTDGIARGRRLKQLHLATCIRETRVNRSGEGHPYTQRSSHLDREASIRHLLVDGASANYGGSSTNGDLCWLHIGNRAVGVDITAIVPSDDSLVTSSKPSEISGKYNLDPSHDMARIQVQSAEGNGGDALQDVRQRQSCWRRLLSQRGLRQCNSRHWHKGICEACIDQPRALGKTQEHTARQDAPVQSAWSVSEKQRRKCPGEHCCQSWTTGRSTCCCARRVTTTAFQNAALPTGTSGIWKACSDQTRALGINTSARGRARCPNVVCLARV